MGTEGIIPLKMRSAEYGGKLPTGPEKKRKVQRTAYRGGLSGRSKEEKRYN